MTKGNEKILEIAKENAENYEGVVADFYSGQNKDKDYLSTLYFETEWMNLEDDNEIRLSDGECYFCINLNKKAYQYLNYQEEDNEGDSINYLEIIDPDNGKRVCLGFVDFNPVDAIVNQTFQF